MDVKVGDYVIVDKTMYQRRAGNRRAKVVRIAATGSPYPVRVQFDDGRMGQYKREEILDKESN